MAEEFRKDDDGKPDHTLIPYYSLVLASHIMAMGAEKYGRSNWKLGGPERYVAAALRHLGEWSDPDYPDRDGESGRSHLGHALCCIMFAVTLEAKDDEGARE